MIHQTQEQVIASCRGKTKKQVMRLLQAEFHKRGWGRLYKRLSRKRKHIIFDRHSMILMLYFIQFKAGDIVHDYTSNHRIIEAPFPAKRTANIWGWKGNGFWRCHMGQFKYEGGVLSCGCGWHPDVAKTRDEIESSILACGTTKGSYFANDERYIKWAQQLRAGEHITDENGIILGAVL